MSWGSRGWPGSGWLNARLKIDGGSVNRSLPVLDLKQTWANSTQTFTGLRLNVTDRGSASSSRLADFQVNGTSRFSIASTGDISLNNGFGTFSTSGFSLTSSFTATFTGVGNSAGFFRTNYGIILLTNSTLGWGSNLNNEATVDTALVRDAAGILAQRNGTNGQIARWSRTHTDASNYERVELDCSTNTFRFGPRAAGTGTARVLYLETGSTVVASLASAATVGTGARAFVTDATATTFASVVAGGGSNRVPVYSDGTDWRIG
jgi:hypothetical protein